MKIYIASSWKNQHGVQLLTERLRMDGHEVISWIENNYEENHAPNQKFDFEKWVNSPDSNNSFKFDTTGAMTSDLLIYYGNGGKDALAECGMAFAKGVPMIALWSKGEDLGLMRKMFRHWFTSHLQVLEYAERFSKSRNPYSCYGNQKPHPMDFDTKEEYEERISNWEKWEFSNPNVKIESNGDAILQVNQPK